MEEGKRKHIWVTDLGACPKKIQFSRTWKLSDEVIQYETYRGSFVHKLFDYIAKKASIERERQYWKELWNYSIIPSPFRNTLKRDLPIYEDKIKKFFLDTKVGRELFKSGIIRIEESLRVPVEDLHWKLNIPLEIQKKYLLTGRPDFRVKKFILEVKSGASIKPEHRLQAMAYKELADRVEPNIKHGYKVLCLGSEELKLTNVSYRRVWLSFKRKAQLAKLLEEAILLREKLEKDPFANIRGKRKPEECAFCPFHIYCMTWRVSWLRNKI